MPFRLNAFFTSSNELGQLTQKARQLMALQQQLVHVIPSSLRRGCRVMQFDQQVLTISADNGAIASKLRQMTTELAAKLHDVGCEVTVIQVVVQVSAPPYTPPSEARTLSLHGRNQLSDFAGKLADSPLKDALNRFVKRR